MDAVANVDEIILDYQPITAAMTRRDLSPSEVAAATKTPVPKVLEITQYANAQKDGKAKRFPYPTLNMFQFIRIADYLDVPLTAMLAGANR